LSMRSMMYLRTLCWRWEREEDSALQRSRCQKDRRSLIWISDAFVVASRWWA
jgi:hypothetical protein